MSTDVLPRPRNAFRAEQRFPTVPRMVRIAAIERTEPGMVRVSFEGSELGEFTRDGVDFPAMESRAFDDVVILCFPDPATGAFFGAAAHELSNPPLSELCSWQGREYTVRRLCQRDKLLTVDFVLHESGIAESWLRTAVVGDPLGIIGTRMSRKLPTEPHILAMGDATAIPALARLVEESQGTTPLEVYVIADRNVLGLSFPTSPQVNVTWIDPAQDAVSQLGPILATQGLRPGTWAWLAGESTLVGKIRRYLIHGHGMDKERIHFTGYWKVHAASNR